MIIVDRQAPTTPEHTHAFESKQTYHDRQRPTVEAAVDEDLVRVDGESKSIVSARLSGRGVAALLVVVHVVVVGK